ncbi:hypothetical protein URH17368_0966 [Alicyclobacillus hesperidum URH17-3-68]|nr:hypothetical protein URH17368_0966 [Alicyclobacillus hesperidum URH17-3-68]
MAQIEIPSSGTEMSLLEKMLERGNMLEALRRVESNKGAPGVDALTVAKLRSYVRTHWAESSPMRFWLFK